MTVELRLAVDWVAGDTTLDVGALAEILTAVADAGTVRAAADRLGLSYRTVWGRLDTAQSLLGGALVVKSPGRGSVLTAAGQELLQLVEDLRGHLKRNLAEERESFERGFRALFSPAEPVLRVACNFDILLDACVHEHLLDEFAVRYMGAGKAIDALYAGEADIAGFHWPGSISCPPGVAALRDDARYAVTPVLEREVGFVVARGNPLGIRRVEDLVRAGARFINRQKNAGTRHWFDALLAEHGIASERIAGYEREEFTHQAVAMAVAAGAADAAFTLKAVTEGLAVDFVPLGRETYYLATRLALVDDPRYRTLQQVMRAQSARHPGYTPADPQAAVRSPRELRARSH